MRVALLESWLPETGKPLHERGAPRRGLEGRRIPGRRLCDLAVMYLHERDELPRFAVRVADGRHVKVCVARSLDPLDGERWRDDPAVLGTDQAAAVRVACA